ncbi:MAG: thioredoxin domain-containing protein [bacterium]
MVAQLIEVTDENFEETILRGDRLALLDFGAEWCTPCKKVHAMLRELLPDWGEKVVIGELDISSSPKTAERYGVVNIPQVLFFKNGQHVETIVGVLPKAKLVEKIKNHLGP